MFFEDETQSVEITPAMTASEPVEETAVMNGEESPSDAEVEIPVAESGAESQDAATMLADEPETTTEPASESGAEAPTSEEPGSSD